VRCCVKNPACSVLYWSGGTELNAIDPSRMVSWDVGRSSEACSTQCPMLNVRAVALEYFNLDCKSGFL